MFVGGKGGVGKTTCAAMLALQSARTRRTLLVSTDPASTLSSVLGRRVGSEPTPVGGAPRLSAASVDSALAFSRWLAPRRDLVASIALEGSYLDSEDVDRLLKLSLPGVDEVIGLLEIHTMARTLAVDAVVVDTAPTGHTLRLLMSPALFARLAAILDALQSHHRTVVSALRGFYVEEPADALITQVAKDATAMTGQLRDRRATELVWVTLPEPAALEETADAVRFLDGAGMHVGRLIVNRMTPRPVAHCDWCEARRRFEARALVPIARRFHSQAIEFLPEVDREPRGLTQLRDLARSLSRDGGSGLTTPAAHRVRAALDGRPSPQPPIFDLAAGARWILFGGKGGVGKSTCAAAAALQLASANPSKRVLLLSTDPAHSLGDILGASVGDAPRSIDGAPRSLAVREIDAAAGFEKFKSRYVDSVDAAFGRLSKEGRDGQTFRQLIDLAPPGIDEVMAIADVAAALRNPSGPHLIVTDTAPTGHALRLLQTPAVLREWTQALMTILLKYREVVGAGTLAALLVDLSKRLRSLETVLTNPAWTRCIIVTRAATAPMEQTVALREALAALDIATVGIIVNAVGAGTCRRCRGAIARQQAHIDELLAAERRKRASHCAIIQTPEEVPPPHGPEALRRWSGAWRRFA